MELRIGIFSGGKAEDRRCRRSARYAEEKSKQARTQRRKEYLSSPWEVSPEKESTVEGWIDWFTGEQD